MTGDRVADYGEQRLLALVQGFCPSAVVGDDGAVLSFTSGQVVVTTDVLVEGVHFSAQTTPAASVGWRSMVANLSDLAAMGADPHALTLGLGLPASCDVAWVKELYQGIQACLSTIGTEAGTSISLVGGDLHRSSQISLAITALGQVQPSHILRRTALQVGDALVVSGYHGASRAGLALLQGDLQPPKSTTNLRQDLIQESIQSWIKAHQYPRPRFDWILALRSLQAALHISRPLAAMDSSDGLADALIQLCRSSGVQAEIDAARIPMPPGLAELVGPEQCLRWALYGGEDFELVLGLPQPLAQALVEEMGFPGAIVGQVIGPLTANPEDQNTRSDHKPTPWVLLRNLPTGSPPQVLDLRAGFQHWA